MADMKHTPGPWQVCHTTIGGKTYGAPWIEPVGADTDIQITGSGGARSYTKRIVEFRGTDDDEANARLIAAAPDLLEAVSELLGQWDAFEASYGNQEEAYYKLAKYARPAWNKARAAASKAGA